MKKLLGVIPLLVYLGAFLFFAFLALSLFNLAESGEIFLSESLFWGITGALAGVLGSVFFGIIACVPLALLIVKIIHLATGWGFFGAINVLADLALAIFFVVGAINTPSEIAPAIFAIVMFVLLSCNVASMTR